MWHSNTHTYFSSVLIQNLDVTVTLYNQVRESILDVEYPLIDTQLADIDKQLTQAISQLNWTSEGALHISDCIHVHVPIAMCS